MTPLLAAASATVVHIDTATAARLTGFVIPVLVALLTKYHAPPAVKAIVNAVLSVVGGAIAAAVATNGAVDLGVLVDGALWAAITSWASYYGLWRPTAVAPKVAEKSAGFGVGPVVQDP